MKKQHILIFLIAICAQLSAFGSILENDNVVKGIAKLNGKNIPIWFNITGEGTAEVGNGKNSAISQYAEGKLVIPASFINTIDNHRNWRTYFLRLQRFENYRLSNHIDNYRQKCFQRL